MATSPYTPTGGAAPGAGTRSHREPAGWMTYAGLLLLLIGAFNVIAGVTALWRKHYYLTGDGGILVWDYNTWGWIWLVIGAIEVLTAVGVLARQRWARALGTVLVVLVAIGQLAFLAAYPLWSLIVIGLCVLAVYALVGPPADRTTT